VQDGGDDEPATSAGQNAIMFRTSNFIADFIGLSTPGSRRAARPYFQGGLWE
jgi:hypothetical protein